MSSPTGCEADRLAARPLLVVDAANVVGSVPDGWWRRRAEATELLRAALEPLAASGLSAAGLPEALVWLAGSPLEVVLVVEGAASGVTGTPAVRVVAARGSGDDAIVELVAAGGAGRRTAVVTADRALRSRVTGLGAAVVGPAALPRRARLPDRNRM
ncbi:MAG TPA: NTP pyrophosphohydrolase [Candidatus Dormibacteraeota bacterium]